jgi:F-type H+-transporting ATPase subunit a
LPIIPIPEQEAYLLITKKITGNSKMNTFNAFHTNISSPLDQFEIRNYISIDAPILFNASLSLTNIGFYIIISGLVAVTFNLLATNRDGIM